MTENYFDVSVAIRRYFDGLYNGDTHLLGEVFSSKAQLSTVTGGELTTIDLASWLTAVSNREAPASRREARLDRIISIEFGSANTASARVECAIGPKLFTDFLSLVLLADGWKIVSKVYQFELLDTRASAASA